VRRQGPPASANSSILSRMKARNPLPIPIWKIRVQAPELDRGPATYRGETSKASSSGKEMTGKSIHTALWPCFIVNHQKPPGMACDMWQWRREAVERKLFLARADHFIQNMLLSL